MFKFAADIKINRPTEQVFTWVTDPEYYDRWVRNLEQAYLTTPPPIDAGSRLVEEVRIPFGTLKTRWQVLEYEPFRLCTFAGQTPIANLEVSYTVEKIRGGAHLTSHGHGEAQRLLRPLAKFLAGPAQAEREKLLVRLKTELERATWDR